MLEGDRHAAAATDGGDEWGRPEHGVEHTDDPAIEEVHEQRRGLAGHRLTPG